MNWVGGLYDKWFSYTMCQWDGPLSGPFCLCCTLNCADTADAAQQLADITDVVAFFNTYNCWSGQIAESPGSNIGTLPSSRDFALGAWQAATCNISTLAVDGLCLNCNVNSHRLSSIHRRLVHLGATM
jgi:hypothetical protein